MIHRALTPSSLFTQFMHLWKLALINIFCQNNVIGTFLLKSLWPMNPPFKFWLCPIFPLWIVFPIPILLLHSKFRYGIYITLKMSSLPNSALSSTTAISLRGQLRLLVEVNIEITKKILYQLMLFHIIRIDWHLSYLCFDIQFTSY